MSTNPTGSYQVETKKSAADLEVKGHLHLKVAGSREPLQISQNGLDQRGQRTRLHLKMMLISI